MADVDAQKPPDKETKRGPSYSEALKGPSKDLVEGMGEDDLDSRIPWNADEFNVSEHEGAPAFWLADRVVEDLAEKWRGSLVIQVFQRRVNFQVMVDRLHALWKPIGKLNVIDLGNFHYLVRCEREEDWNRALFDGPWSLFASYLLVQPWTSGFDVDVGIKSVMAWVRFPNLPIHLYNKFLLTEFGNKIGRTIKIDMTTLSAERGRFARVAVELDMTKPLIGRFLFNGKWQRVEYEHLPSICFSCGRIGHTQNVCPYDNAHPREEMSRDMNVDHDRSVGNNNNEISTGFGPWLHVGGGRRVGGKRLNANIPGAKLKEDEAGTSKNRMVGKKSLNGSRFEVISDENVEEVEVVSETQLEESVKPTSYKMEPRGAKEHEIQGGRQIHNNEEGKKHASARVVVGPSEADVKKAPRTVGPISHHQGVRKNVDVDSEKRRELPVQKEPQKTVAIIPHVSQQQVGSSSEKNGYAWKPFQTRKRKPLVIKWGNNLEFGAGEKNHVEKIARAIASKGHEDKSYTDGDMECDGDAKEGSSDLHIMCVEEPRRISEPPSE